MKTKMTFDEQLAELNRLEDDAESLWERAKCYEVVLSTKDRIKCDADEVWRVYEGIKTGSPVKLRQGVFNPSFYVTIVLDDKRRDNFWEEIRKTIDSHRQFMDRGVGKKGTLPEFQKLVDIFDGVNIKNPNLNLPNNGKESQKILPPV